MPGFKQALLVEGAFDADLLVEVDFVEHFGHQVALFDADAMFAGQHAADLDAEPQYVGAEILGALQFARHIGVEQDQRMQIAVAGVKDIGDAQAMFLRQLADAGQHVRECFPRGMVPSMQR